MKRKTIRKIVSLLILILIICTVVPGCSNPQKADEEGTDAGQSGTQTWQLNDFVMSTVLQATVYGTRDVTAQIKEKLDALEHEDLSWRDLASTVARVNEEAGKSPGCQVSPEFAAWVNKSLDLASDSGGAFDPSIGNLTRLWDIEGDNPRVPDARALAEVMKNLGYQAIYVEENRIRIDGDRTLDLGAVGKGIACDLIRDALKGEWQDEVSGAVVSVGGSILVCGSKPDGSDWKVAIQDPEGADGEYMGYISLKGDTVVSTSGDYEKYFIEDGVKYHHILDPHTGYPADSGLTSVTVICEDGLLSDGLSTACFILGREKGMALLEKYGARGIFIDKDKRVTVTEGIRDAFTVINEDYQIGH